jgi:hypothetical protein
MCLQQISLQDWCWRLFIFCIAHACYILGGLKFNSDVVGAPLSIVVCGGWHISVLNLRLISTSLAVTLGTSSTQFLFHQALSLWQCLQQNVCIACTDHHGLVLYKRIGYDRCMLVVFKRFSMSAAVSKMQDCNSESVKNFKIQQSIIVVYLNVMKPDFMKLRFMRLMHWFQSWC